MKEEPLEVVHLDVEQRQGQVYVSSKDVPGLWLWGSPEQVFSDVCPVLEQLYKHQRGLDVVAREQDEGTRPQAQLGVKRIPHTYLIYRTSSERQERVNG